ncbi:MAG: PqqD family protein [Pseudomonadota bacterium]
MSEVDGEIMLISVTSGRYYGLDMVGSEIWRRLQTPTRFGDLSAGLQSYFKGDTDEIDREALAFVSKLVDRGLVDGAERPA